ncbi:MAG: 4Fe-4S binding protein [Proteobacteria bacterium]|nr:4Fe-4S binding protein [Desulfocapsa sp.]MBU3945980.1 4Fe-4S binding protein [Pseudomonadota bacterium]MCG2742561.1 4Fe-4S binding protein [Desulfobacteraceae bacterium]MBU3982824.1 4Fe-4S binding protein [Pseudomonadota bacterium]MBU4029952.1 4Fe-4S binding protein [Pseudomonadota bacterium]
MKNKKRIPAYYWRRASQLVCLALFFFLFIRTDYSGRDEIEYAVNILFRIDPLLALSASVAAGFFIVLMLPAVVTLLLTLILGRFFCGWVCPMGTLLDGCHTMASPQGQGRERKYRFLKFYLLGFLLVGAWFGLPLAGYVDPFSILVRSLALAVDPALNALATTFFTYTYEQAPAWVNGLTEPLYTFLKATILPFNQKYYDLTVLSLVILLVVFLLERLERRFFCRNICPLGALFAVTARFSLLRGRAGTKCGTCRNCRDVCRMGAIDEERNISPLDCNLCLDCIHHCPGNKISFQFGGLHKNRPTFALSRRSFVGSLALGAALPFFLKSRTLARQADPLLIRPPGALSEEEFIGRCVRCGECMKVCIGNGLQPAFLQGGLEGMFSPVLKARTGYCEYNCTLCGQVCPSGAIRKLALEEKQKVKIGNACFDRNRCLPYAKGIPCMVCEEHCPTPDKAIKFREVVVENSRGEKVSVKQPYLVDELCVGCGICETKCPLPGVSAVMVTSAGESRNPAQALPDTGNTGYP